MAPSTLRQLLATHEFSTKILPTKTAPSCALAALIILSSFASESIAQESQRIGRAKLLAANAVLGGLTAAIGQGLAGKSFWKGFVKGSVGGTFVYTGKCLIAQRNSATDWLGRSSVAIGSSIVANGAANRPMLRELAMPIGPFRIYRNNKTRRQRIRLNLSTAITAAYFAFQPRTSFQLGGSLEHGALIFEDLNADVPYEAAGIVKLYEWPFPARAVVAHELIHVAQDDFVGITWEDPLEGWLLARVPAGSHIHKYVDIGILQPVRAIVSNQIPVRDRPWEKEAHSFDAGC